MISLFYLFFVSIFIDFSCLQANIPVLINAHLLMSMRNKRLPLRSEMLDIANCIIDGADALVLSAETAIGMYPVETIACLASACKEGEACVWTKRVFNDFIDKVSQYEVASLRELGGDNP